MPEWKRSSKDYIIKRAKMPDGAFLHLLLGKTPRIDDELDASTYRSLQDLKRETNRAAIWCLGAAAFGVLSHFHALDRAGTMGLDVSPKVFSHVSLFAYSLGGALLCFSYSKLAYCRSWFAFKFKKGLPSERALYLLKYPDTFFHFQYYPAAIGTPKNIISSGSMWPQLLSMILIFLAICIATVGSVALWLIMMWDVLHSTDASGVVSYLTIILSAILVLLGWTIPIYGRSDRSYTHHGMVRLLGDLEEDDRAAAHRRISAAANRMGLIEPPHRDD